MKKIVSILLICFACCMGTRCMAESPLPVHLDLTLGMGTPCKDIRPFDASLGLNYNIRQFSLHAIWQADIFVPKNGMTSNYNLTSNLGGGLGYRFLSSKCFEARGFVTTTVGHSDFRNTSYNLGLYWHCGAKCFPSPIIGIGYNCKDFSAAPTYHGAYVSFSFRF